MAMAKTDSLLTRRVEKILPSAEKLANLIDKQKIRLYQGFDPTGKLHIGHGIGLKLLMEFAAAGHEVIFLFGTGTVLVGDPSQRENSREPITEEQIKQNIEGWKSQAKTIVDFGKVAIKENGEWLSELSLKDIIKIGSQISAVQLFKRESFQRRLDKGDTVWYHETMYPLLQGYDSVVMDVDLEIGGSDQEFNMLMGRELQKKINNKEKYVLTLPLIMGTDGQKMSASKGNCVWMDDSPGEMYGKLMSIPDTQTMPYLKLCTDVSEDGMEKVSKMPPRDAKDRMARAIVEIYHGAKTAEAAAKNFDAQFKEGKTPSDIPEVNVPKSEWAADELLVEVKLANSKSEARRLIEQGGAKLNDQKVEAGELVIKDGDVIQVGKRKFVKILAK